MASFIRPKPISPLLLLSILIPFSCILAPASARLGRSCHGSRTAFSFPDFNKDSQSFITLLGDAQISDSGLQFSASQPHSVGGVFYSKPVRFLQPFRPRNSVSFSSFFSFSMGSKDGSGLAFVIVPNKNFDGINGQWRGVSPAKNSVSVKNSVSDLPPLRHIMAIEFDSSMNEEVKPDPKGIDVGPDTKTLFSLKASENLGINDGERLFAWIDYRAPVNVLEVRLSKSKSQRPENPTLSFHVDLSGVWTEEMFVGFSSSMGDSQNKHIIYSWSFVTIDTRVQPGWQGPHARHPHPGWFGPRFDHRGWHGFNGGRPGHPEWHHPHPDFPDWQQHPHPEWRQHPHPDWQQHPHPDWQHGPPHHHDSWAYSMDDVWRIVVALLFGATCGTVVAASIVVVWSFIRRRFGSSVEDGEAGGILYGYQKLTTTDTEGKADSNYGYQKLPTIEAEGKTDSK